MSSSLYLLLLALKKISGSDSGIIMDKYRLLVKEDGVIQYAGEGDIMENNVELGDGEDPEMKVEANADVSHELGTD
jgi:hypothetical protein